MRVVRIASRNVPSPFLLYFFFSRGRGGRSTRPISTKFLKITITRIPYRGLISRIHSHASVLSEILKRSLRRTNAFLDT